MRKSASLVVSVLAAASLSCLLTHVLTTQEGMKPNRTEPQVDEPYRSPNASLVSELKLGSHGYRFQGVYDDESPSWSPDGRRIAFSSNRDGDYDIYLIDPDGHNLTNLTADPSPSLATLLFLLDKSIDRWPAWSPLGDRIAFASSRTNIMMRSSPVSLLAMGSDGFGLEQLTDTIDHEGLPDWAPDGENLVFASTRDGGVNIYRMNTTNLQEMLLTEAGEKNDFPDWSPTGDQIVFESDRDGNLELYVMNPDGSEITRLTDHPAADGQPAWSPDGGKIVFVSERQGDGELFLMDANGSNLTQLTDNDVHDSEPAWSPDGRRIAFASETDSGRRLFLLDVDGSNPTQLTGTAVESPPEQNAIYHLHRGVFMYLGYMRTAQGSLDEAVDAFSEAMALDPGLGEAYLGRGMARLSRCEILWAHAIGAEIQVIQDNDDCPDAAAALADIEKSLQLGLAPALQPGVKNLLELLQ